ncbi:MAG: amidase [Anaerolineae bacterium]|nr:amidase [Anaerolineae bacterium]
MFIQPAHLTTLAAALRNDQLTLADYINEVCSRVAALDPQLQALLPEPDRRARLLREAAALQATYPDPARRPPLYGVLVSVKDIFRADGFPTKAGSQLPPHLFDGAEAPALTTLKRNGALVLGKTVTTEFAFFEPGPTRNPHHLDHTPGGSSSGSAAAVAAGYCPLAFGTQTIGSMIRPAAYCGVVGFKPSYGRIDTAGVIPISKSLDHIGLFAQDVEGIRLAASLLCHDWRSVEPLERLPMLGVPDGAYLAQASPAGLEAFERQLIDLERAGYRIVRIAMLDDIGMITAHNTRIMSAEMADVHREWFAQYESLYRPRTAGLIRDGQQVSPDALQAARAMQKTVRDQLETLMKDNGVDAWVSPAATGPAPQGIESTGSPAMNLPWTFAGLPAITVPAGQVDGLPAGLQCVTAYMADEYLLEWVRSIANIWAI